MIDVTFSASWLGHCTLKTTYEHVSSNRYKLACAPIEESDKPADQSIQCEPYGLPRLQCFFRGKTKTLIRPCGCADWFESSNSLYAHANLYLIQYTDTTQYEGCSNMNASSFITFFTYMPQQNVIPFWKELFVAFKMAPSINKHSLYFSRYRPLYKDHSCILKVFWSKWQCTFWYMCRYNVISL